jgi:hypothetical protein
MWAFWITHMNAYLCAILCLVIGVEGNIQNNEVIMNWRFYAQFFLKTV